MRHDAADARILHRRAGPPAGEHVVRAARVVRLAVGHRTHHAKPVGDLRRLLERFRKIDAVQLRLHRAQRAAVFNRRQKLRIKRFLRRNAAREKDIDHRLRPGLGGDRLGLQFQDVAQGQAQAADQADKEELTAVGLPHVFGAVATITEIGIHIKAYLTIQRSFPIDHCHAVPIHREAYLTIQHWFSIPLPRHRLKSSSAGRVFQTGGHFDFRARREDAPRAQGFAARTVFGGLRECSRQDEFV